MLNLVPVHVVLMFMAGANFVAASYMEYNGLHSHYHSNLPAFNVGMGMFLLISAKVVGAQHNKKRNLRS